MRRLFNILSILSLLLFVGGATLCIVGRHRSFTVHEWGNSMKATAYRVSVSGSGISMQKFWGKRLAPPQAGILDLNTLSGWDVWGFHYHRSVIISKTLSYQSLPGMYGNEVEFWVEMYWPLLATMLLPAWWLVQRLRHGRLRQRRTTLGLCPVCGYDLRASKERCPECGNPIPVNTVREAIQ